MKLKKLPGFSLGLIALAVGNAYATQLLDDYSIISYMTDEESPIEIKDNNPISNGEYLTTEDESHAVKVDDGVTGYINNASVMDLARKLSISIVAEGVETKEQLDYLNQNYITFQQGYYFYKPVTYIDLVKIILSKPKVKVVVE